LRYTTRELALIAIFSCLGAVLNVPIGYLGNYLKTIPLLPFGFGQILSGLHIFILVLSSLYLKKPGASTMTATVKGLVEVVLFSFHGIPVILMSALQGLILDVIVYLLRKHNISYILGGGIAAISNVAYIQFFLNLPFPVEAYALMYLLASLSGLVFGRFGGLILYKMVENRMEHSSIYPTQTRST